MCALRVVGEPKKTAGPTLRGAAESLRRREGPSVELLSGVRRMLVRNLSSPSTLTIKSTES